MASIRERSRAGRQSAWAVLYRHHGKQQSKTFTTRKEAERFRSLIDTLDIDRALSLLAEEQQGYGTKLDEIAERWLDYKKRDLSRRAHLDYERDYANWIAPHLGHRAAALITESDVQAWVDNQLAPHLSPKTVADRHAILHGIYKWASTKKLGHVPHNPCLETDLPKRSKKPPKGLTLPEWLTLKDAAYRVNPEAADIIVFMANTGWRIGEATALMASGVDDSGRNLYVTMTHVNRKGEGVVEGGKSEASEGRRVRVLPEGARMLRRRLVGLGLGDYVFTNSRSPTGLWEPSTLRNRWWAKSVVEAGLEHRHPTPHWLRHTHVMLCHMAGMSIAEIQRRIGHEDIKTTMNVYGRMIDDMPDDVADRLDALLSGRGLPVAGEVLADPRELD